MPYVRDKEKRQTYSKKWRESHPNYMKEWRRKHPDYFFRYFQNIKLNVLTHYGNGKPACTRCGLTDIRVLSIDHINGGGHIHHQKVQRAGNAFYHWLIHNHYPLGFQTLCMNCQFIKRFENHESHK